VKVPAGVPLALRGDAASGCHVLVLQGKPIGEPVAQRGPFVMNTQQEIMQAQSDYQRTRFGGWRWGRDDPVHPRDAGRFALLPDGTRAVPPKEDTVEAASIVEDL
jgi:hypothetical protein